ncbi:Activator of stress protein [Spathaspora sp. JA1]|nr:Activator of stress protein [Spathaspora sp. JA1]
MSKRELPFQDATEFASDGSAFNLSSNSTISNNSSDGHSKNTTNHQPAQVITNNTNNSPINNNLLLNSSLNMPFNRTNKSAADAKRRRVTRACDNCRQKKVKCDGKQPCIHCTVYSYKCSYDQPNIRNKRNSGIPAPAQPNLAVLQAAAAAAAAAASGNNTTPTPNEASMEGNDSGVLLYPSSNLIVCQQILNVLLPKLKLNCFDQNMQFDIERFQKLVNIVESRSPEFAQNIGEICDYIQDPETPVQNIQVHHSYNNNNNTRKLSVSSNDEVNSTATPGAEIKLYLPNKETALQLIYTTWNKGCVLFRFYHRPSLLEEVDLLYRLDPSNYGDRQQRFLPFLYSILACGCLFSRSSAGNPPDINENSEDDGFKYFLEARKLIDISNVGDINSIQTIVMMIIYLQCSARLSTCYSYIGIAMRSALKEGLHRNLSIFQNSRRKLDPIEMDTRKRLFYTIYKMDIYINSLLGLPRSINEDEFDQELPAELDDENITRTEYLYDQQQGRLSSSGCANHHTKLMLILSHIIKQLYPIKVKNSDDELTSSANHYSPDKIHTKVTNLELELKNWLLELPVELKPIDPNISGSSKKVGEKFLLANYYLHLAFLNCQIMLYRPFIHFISDGNSKRVSSDPRSLIRGRNCIKVARMVVKLANKMIDQNLLVGTYWFSMYTIFFSIACLVYYFHFANYANNNSGESGVNYAGILFDDDLSIDMIKQDIEIGKKVLDCLKNSSRSSLRIYNILNTLFEQLNRRTATTSRMIVDEQPPHPNGEQMQAGLMSSVKSENVQNTFKNFHTINNFEASPTDSSYAAYAKKDLGQLFEDTNLAQYQSSVEATQSDSTKLGPIREAPGTTSSEDEPSADYMPGVFDKLDTQIFGKILPPYMLESNVNYEQTHQQPLQPISLPPPQMTAPEQQLPGQGPMQSLLDPNGSPALPMIPQNGVLDIPGRSTLNLDDFDFYSLNNGDTTNLQYLDPFNPMNAGS